MNIWGYITIASSVLMTILILIQVRGAGLGAGLGGTGSSEINLTRRGADKTIYNATIVIATIFVLSILLQIILA